jgi:hypothetical protein
MIQGKKVFISHAPEDAHFARQIHKALGLYGLECFSYSRDRCSLQLPWRNQSAPIAEAGAFITLLSTASIDSYWQMRELNAARKVQQSRKDPGFAIIPLVMPGIKPSMLLLWFREGMDLEPLPFLAPEALHAAVERVMVGLAVPA